MGPRKKPLGCLIPLLALILFNPNLVFGEFCGSTITLRVTAEYHERSLNMSSSYVESIHSSSSFKKTYDKFSMEMSSGGGFKGFSASRSMAFETVKDKTTRTDEYRESIEREMTEYNENFLQIFREVTSEISIDGVSARVVEEIFVDSVPINQTLSPDQLITLAEDYIEYEYGNDDGEGEINGSTFTETVCMGK